jgi:hypothetical protein
VPPQPQLEQANQSLVAQSGARNTRRVINTPLAFLIKSALNTTSSANRAGWAPAGAPDAICSVTISAAKPGPPTAQKMRGSPATARAW